MAGLKSRDKGKRGEREVAEFLREHGVPARRGVQYRGGPDAPDVAHDLVGFHFEVKRSQALRLYKALEQAMAEKRQGDIPVVWHRPNGRPWVVLLRAEDFLVLAKGAAA